jgi:hypothetical protein
MLLSKNLVERFQAAYVNKNSEVIGYTEAESQLKQLAELVRLTVADVKEYQYAKAI